MFIRWDEDGHKTISSVAAGQTYVLPANSITFALIESRIMLPSYIAMRFNLRIKHVHRGLLLGTGPLVDPEFVGDLLIPLHNLTSDEYEINSDEGLIWMEFTKTSHIPDPSSSVGHLEEHKRDVGFETYFERASGNNPIRSSIPQAIREARERVSMAERSARIASRTNQLFAGIGVLAIAAAIITLLTYFGQINANVIASNTLVESVKDEVYRAITSMDKIAQELNATKARLDTANQKIGELEERINLLSKNPSTTLPKTDMPPPTPNVPPPR
jgi:hypothetical protein